MPSGVVRNLIRRGPKFVVSIGMHHGGPPGADGPGADGPPHDEPAAHDESMMHHDQQPDMKQQAYDQVVEGLQHLAEEYPEAKSFLQKFEQLYAGWMGGQAKSAATEQPPSTPEPSPAEAPADTGGDQSTDKPPFEG